MRASKQRAGGPVLCVHQPAPAFPEGCHAISAAKCEGPGPPACHPKLQEGPGGVPPPLSTTWGCTCAAARAAAAAPLTGAPRRLCTTLPSLLLLLRAAGRELLLLPGARQLRGWVSPWHTCGSTRAPSPRTESGLQGGAGQGSSGITAVSEPVASSSCAGALQSRRLAELCSAAPALPPGHQARPPTYPPVV